MLSVRSDFGARGDGTGDDTVALEQALRVGGCIGVPLGVYPISRALYIAPGTRLVGESGASFGKPASTIRALPTGDFTNGAYPQRFMLKAGPGIDASAGSHHWSHGTSVEGVEFDCNRAPTTGMHFWQAGEHFRLDRVRVKNAGVPGQGAVQIHGGGATLDIGNLNLTGNAGPGLEIIDGNGGNANVVSGDLNGGPLIRINGAGRAGDPTQYRFGYVKSESNDPVVLLDGCGMVHVQLEAGKILAPPGGGKYVVLIDKPAPPTAGKPEVTSNLEGGNPYNDEYVWNLYDATTGRGARAGSIATGLHREVRWNRPSTYISGS